MITTLPQRVASRASTTPRLVAMREKHLGVWRDITWSEYHATAALVAHGLADLGVTAADRVGILSENRPEWLYCDIATLGLRAITVGFYPTSPAPEIEYQLRDAGVRVLIAEDQEQVDKVLAIQDSCPSLEFIVFLEPRGLMDLAGPRLLSFEELLERGKRHQATSPALLEDQAGMVQPGDIATLIYTSGTTGPPKGAMLTVANIDFAIDALLGGSGIVVPKPSPSDVTLSFLPLCHVAERMFTVWNNAANGVVVHFAESIDTVAADLAEVQPTLLFAVPRIWEKLRSGVTIRMLSASPAKRAAYRISDDLNQRIARIRTEHGGDHTVASRALYVLGYPLAFRALRDKLGLRKVRAAFSGAAPISPEVLAFFLGIGVPMLEVYGMTENTAVAAANRPGSMKLGTVGEPIEGIDLAVDPDSGEILTRHPANFAGYWNRAESGIDAHGWLHTGDIGEWVDGSHLRIVDRIKDIIITAGGKNISPSEIENQLKNSPHIKEAIVIGDQRPYLTALIGIDFDSVADWASRRGMRFTTYRDLAGRPEVLELVQGIVDGTNARLARVASIRKFRLLPKELDHDDGELTATQKVRRKALAERFEDLIDDMYQGAT
ncbi:AMP-binding protein [Hoyosella sp. G463]|uniref:Acyl-CoA synthetase n=1 Tax=Lolliginicoccus lacisalsi TaxID=2742202 RepID=A0A927PLP8_9ACTN|nr:AMP-binding protein [Lolliginicoccus lacisalsi]MBD8507078.1 AMP-binding protein [Lolliginicoccus lacisalsi]